MQQDIRLEVSARLVDRLARSFVGNFSRLGLVDQASVREYVHEVLVSEWREQQESSWTEGMEELEALSNQFPSE